MKLWGFEHKNIEGVLVIISLIIVSSYSPKIFNCRFLPVTADKYYKQNGEWLSWAPRSWVNLNLRPNEI